MNNVEFHVGEYVCLPSPFDDVVGRVLRIHGAGPQARVTVEYTLSTGDEGQTSAFLAHELKHAALA